MSIVTNAWGDVGTALYEVPDTELTALSSRLRGLADADPGRAANVLIAFAVMVETERDWRNQEATRACAASRRP